MKKSLKTKILVLEKELLSSEARSSTERLNKLLADDFIEIGESGRKYKKADIIELLACEKYPPQLAIRDFEITNLAGDLVLATYETRQKSGGTTLRCSIWKRAGSHGWKIRYHQGTKGMPNHGGKKPVAPG